MEDLDLPRVRPGAAERILEDLAWLGLDWEEGPDRGGPNAPYEQSCRRELYEVALRKLVDARRIYPCFCSRRDIAAAASAPQVPGDEVRYPGTCRELDPDEVRRRVRGGEPHAWRFRGEEGEQIAFVDLVRGPWANGGQSPGDFVVCRADGVPAYQLAVVVDDAAMDITEVVRGDDLLHSTSRQILLYRTLQLEPPAFGHVPLFLGPDGVRLSKRHQGASIRELRMARRTPEQVIGAVAHRLGLQAQSRPRSAVELIRDFSMGRLTSAPAGITVDPRRWK